jgi:hypothetical protein
MPFQKTGKFVVLRPARFERMILDCSHTGSGV